MMFGTLITAAARRRRLTPGKKRPARSRTFGFSWAWADAPAILFGIVRAATVMTGARLLRGQPIIMLVLGAAVASFLFLIEKQVVDRVSAIRPRENFLALLICWLLPLTGATFLSTVTAFEIVAPTLSEREHQQHFREHWLREAGKIETYLIRARTAFQQQLDSTQVEHEAEQRRFAIARRDRAPYSLDPLRTLRRQLNATAELQRKADAIRPLPIEPPADQAKALEELGRAFREAVDLHVAAASTLIGLEAPPRYDSFTPPERDIQSVLFAETARGSWPAVVAWGMALWIELTCFAALWRGGRRVPLATRIRERRRWWRDLVSAILGRDPVTVLDITIEPLHVRGSLRVALPPDHFAFECRPLLEDAVRNLPTVGRHCRLGRLTNADGEEIDEDTPLIPQLNGEPLIVWIEEEEAA